MTPIQKELEEIRMAHGGILCPEDMVEWADKHPDSELYSRLCWDDEEAAHAYRLEQCRQVIRVEVVILQNDNAPIRAYVSLRQDRAYGNSYRRTEDVMKSPELREALLDQALADAERFRARWQHIQALAPIFEAMDKVRKKRPPTGS